MKKGKAAWLDKITTEDLQVLRQFLKVILTKILFDVYNAKCIPNDMVKLVLIARPREAIKSELF